MTLPDVESAMRNLVAAGVQFSLVGSHLTVYAPTAAQSLTDILLRVCGREVEILVRQNGPWCCDQCWQPMTPERLPTEPGSGVRCYGCQNGRLGWHRLLALLAEQGIPAANLLVAN